MSQLLYSPGLYQGLFFYMSPLLHSPGLFQKLFLHTSRLLCSPGLYQRRFFYMSPLLHSLGLFSNNSYICPTTSPSQGQHFFCQLSGNHKQNKQIASHKNAIRYKRQFVRRISSASTGRAASPIVGFFTIFPK